MLKKGRGKLQKNTFTLKRSGESKVKIEHTYVNA